MHERKTAIETPDPTPVAIPVGMKRPESIHDMVARFVRTELSRRAQDAGHETFEEADDFEVGDDYDPKSPYEVDDDLPTVKELRQRQLQEEEEARGKPAPSPSPGNGAPPAGGGEAPPAPEAKPAQ